VSSKSTLTYGGSADAGAPAGKAGTLLLDPKNLNISAAPAGIYPQYDLINPHPTVGGIFGLRGILSNGNAIATDLYDNFGGTHAGAVYLFNGLTGALVSSLFGSNPNDLVGYYGIASLTNGNYLVLSPIWNGARGAVTWASGTAGVSGVVSPANSLVGGNANDLVGTYSGGFYTVTPLSNGNYLVISTAWDNNRGAVTWGSGTTGISGVVSADNSLVGSNPSDLVSYQSSGSRSVTLLSNGNYVVKSPFWNGTRGAVTWGSGTAGVRGVVSEANSLLGSTPNDRVGDDFSPIIFLGNGNLVVQSPSWNGNRGAITWGSATAGVAGTISAANSLVGSDANDRVGNGGITILSNGNYVVGSPFWNSNRGAVTWGSGTTGVAGTITAINSVVGNDPNDRVANVGIKVLSTGDYLVGSSLWNGNRGAVTWGSATTGINGTISAANSFIGTNANDQVSSGGITVLSSGNYLILSPLWNGNRGAVTWVSRTTVGTTGTVSSANSLVGSHANDRVSNAGITLLNNGNYVVQSPSWNGNRGAVTWGNGTTGTTGTVSEANSLVGSSPNDQVGQLITLLTNGNYLVHSPSWNANHGAVTWGSATTAILGAVSAANSLVGSNSGDFVGSYTAFSYIILLSNGNYVLQSTLWNGSRGAATWGSGETGVSGVVSAANSLVGTDLQDGVGFYITPLTNGNYLVRSPFWNHDRGAVTWGSGTTGISGVVSDANSLVGDSPNDDVGIGVTPLINGNYVVDCFTWNRNRGAVTWGSGTAGVSGVVSGANSLTGSSPNDDVGGGSIHSVTVLSNGNYLVVSPFWNSNRGAVTWCDGTTGLSGVVSDTNSLVGSSPDDQVAATAFSLTLLSNGNYVVQSEHWNGDRGAVTWGNGTMGVSGVVSEGNSLVGSNPNDRVGYNYFSTTVTPLSNGSYVVRSPFWNGSRGAATLVNGTTGQTLDGRNVITQQNSLEGQLPNGGATDVVEDPLHQCFLIGFSSEGGGRVTVGLTDPTQLSYARAQAQIITITPDFLTHTLNTGTAVLLQASNDITIEDPIHVDAGGQGGVLTLQAGRSILINASITTDNGALTLIANDTLADGVADAQRDPGNAFITMAGGTVLDTGTGPLDIELRDGAGLTNNSSRAINLQSVTAGSVAIVNNGPSAGSDIRLETVATNGPQSYSNPHGTATVAGYLLAGGSQITFTDSVTVNADVAVGFDGDTVDFAGSGTQTLQNASGSQFSNFAHTGGGTLQLMGGLNVIGSFLDAAGTFDANDQMVTVSGLAQITDGAYLAGTAPQNFHGGLVLMGGLFTSSTGPMTVTGPIAVVNGLLTGQGTIESLTDIGGTLAPSPGILSVAGSVTLFASSTFSVTLNGTDPGSYSQVSASGPVNLGGSTLELTLGFAPQVGDAFTLISSAFGPIIGTFAGLDEGATFTQDGILFQITYQGGPDGNSVVLTRLS
jgi:hypothetical protein